MTSFVPLAYRRLPRGVATIAMVGAVLLPMLIVAGLLLGPAEALLSARAELTLASAIALLAAALSVPGTVGRVRTVRLWITAAIGLWLVAELVRNAELAVGVDTDLRLSHLPFAGVLACAGFAYAAALKGKLARSEQTAVYLDGAIVFFTTAALLMVAFGAAASATVSAAIDLVYAIFFMATTGATLLLDLAVRAERRASGAYVVLAGLVFLGLGFLWRVAASPELLLHESGPHVHLLAIGVFVVMLGTITWTDTVDEHPGYVRFATWLRAAMPIGAIALTPVIIAIQFLSDLPGPIQVLNRAAVALVLLTVALRQSVLLRDRESSIRREHELGGELSSAERKYRSLVERQPGMVYMAEPGATGRWHFVSPKVQAMLGYTPDEWLADPGLWARSIHPDDREAVIVADAMAGHPGATRRFEYRMIRRDGRVVWVLDDIAVAESPDGKPMLQGLLMDITAAKTAEEALRTSEEQQRMIIETASYAFVAIDSAGLVLDWNQQAEETFGWPRAEAIGAELAELIIPPALRDRHRGGLRRYGATGVGRILSRRMELEAMHRDGHHFPVELTIWPVRHGDTIRFNALVDDITARKELEGQLRHQALHDSLTGLANRALFADRVQHALDRSSRFPEVSLSVLFLDLDDFKTINDSLGHSAGDELLVEVSRRLEHTLRSGDTAARLGGDEFGVLLEDASTDVPRATAGRLLNAFKQPFTVQGQQVQVHASIGIAVGTHPATPEELLRNADLAMYMAKQRGKGRYEVFESRMHEAALRRLELKAALERAIAHEELEVHYQPIVELQAGRVIGFEALLRWRDSDGQFIPVPEVIALAEETGLIVPIGRFVLREACRQALQWSAPDGTPMHMAVNVSASQLEQGTVVRDVRAALRQSGLDPSALTVEITESTLIDDSLSAIRELRQLRKLGVQLALDDFGTGYSSLGRLRHLPFDIVKIDRSFVSRVTEEREGAVVQSILEMAATMGLRVVAEGIETPAQLVALRARGCLVGQGYHFSRPVAPEAVDAILAAGRLPLTRRRLQAVAEALPPTAAERR